MNEFSQSGQDGEVLVHNFKGKQEIVWSLWDPFIDSINSVLCSNNGVEINIDLEYFVIFWFSHVTPTKKSKKHSMATKEMRTLALKFIFLKCPLCGK